METFPSELEKFWKTDDNLTACERADAFGVHKALRLTETATLLVFPKNSPALAARSEPYDWSVYGPRREGGQRKS